MTSNPRSFVRQGMEEPPFLKLIAQHGVPRILKAIEAVAYFLVMPERLKNQ